MSKYNYGNKMIIVRFSSFTTYCFTQKQLVACNKMSY